MSSLTPEPPALGPRPTAPPSGGWPQQAAPGGPFPPQLPYGAPPTPPRKGRGGLVALIVVVVLLVGAGIGTGAWLLLGSDDDTVAADPAPSTTVTSIPTTPTSSAATPAPTPTPTPSSKGPAFTYRTYAHDWDFRLGHVALSARFVKGWDFDTCGPVEVSRALTRIGCQQASEIVHRAEGGHLAVSDLVLTMASETDADKAVADDLITATSWRFDHRAWVVQHGRWRVASVGRHVVLTLVSHDSHVSDNDAEDYLHYRGADLTAALRFGGF